MTFRIEHRVGVAAPASAIWDVISDLERWGEWNPVYPEARGQLAIGQPLELRLELPGRKTMRYTGTVVDWVPDSQLVWSATLARGMIRTLRYIEIEALTEEGCILANGEIYDGVAAPLLPRKLRRTVRDAFATMNERAKARAEALTKGLRGANAPALERAG